MEQKKVPTAVIRRMPRYYRFINDKYMSGVQRISSEALAKEMGITASQIRQDLNCFGGFGQQGYGYNVEGLRSAISEILGINRKKSAIIIGAGNIGHALINNFNFRRSGFDLIGAFDVDPKLCGQFINNVKIMHINELDQFLKENKVDIAVLSAPKQVVVDLAVKLCGAGIRGLWNFTSVDLKLYSEINVPVEDVYFSDSLMVLSYKLQ